ncbi:MAG: hypothetical protein ABI833_10770 [Acidobacteriota bacterium]
MASKTSQLPIETTDAWKMMDRFRGRRLNMQLVAFFGAIGVGYLIAWSAQIFHF